MAQLIGMIAATSWLDTTVWNGPLSTATNGEDFSVLMGALSGGAVYFVPARRGVRAERPAAEAEADATLAAVG